MDPFRSGQAADDTRVASAASNYQLLPDRSFRIHMQPSVLVEGPVESPPRPPPQATLGQHVVRPKGNRAYHAGADVQRVLSPNLGGTTNLVSVVRGNSVFSLRKPLSADTGTTNLHQIYSLLPTHIHPPIGGFFIAKFKRIYCRTALIRRIPALDDCSFTILKRLPPSPSIPVCSTCGPPQSSILYGLSFGPIM